MDVFQIQVPAAALHHLHRPAGTRRKNATIESLFHIAKGLNLSLGELLAHLGEIPEGAEKTDSLPLSIYRKLMLLPPEKQKRLSCIMDAILSFSEI